MSSEKNNQYIPKDVSEFSDTALMITWGDGHESIYLFEDFVSSALVLHAGSSGRTQSRVSSLLKRKFH